MDITLWKEKKKELGYTNQDIADLADVPLGTVQKIFACVTRNPRHDTVRAIERILFSNGQRDAMPVRYGDHSDTDIHGMILRDTSAAQKHEAWDYGRKNGKESFSGIPEGDGYTYSDYLALPDDLRAELIDGRFYDMGAPNLWHQMLIGRLYLQLTECQKAHPDCMVLLSPLDVLLDKNDKTVVQPDLMVVCDKKKMRTAGLFGAPDFVIEIISPSTRRKDYTLKAYKYQNAGVREYWIVDYERGIVIVYDIEHDMIIRLYRMEDDIPVSMVNGECVIRMGENTAYLKSAGYGQEVRQ